MQCTWYVMPIGRPPHALISSSSSGSMRYMSSVSMRGHDAAVGSAGRDTAVLIVNMPLPGVWFHAVFVCGSCFCFFFLFFFFSPVSSRPLHERGLAWLGWPAIGCIVCTRRCSNKSSSERRGSSANSRSARGWASASACVREAKRGRCVFPPSEGVCVSQIPRQPKQKPLRNIISTDQYRSCSKKPRYWPRFVAFYVGEGCGRHCL